MVRRMVFVGAAVGLGLPLSSASCGTDDVTTLTCPAAAATFRIEAASGYTLWCKLPDGVASGPYEERDAADGVRVVGAFSDGLADGLWRRFAAAPDYTQIAEEAYADGRPNARWRTWDASGALTSDHRWAYGTPCGTWLELDAGVETSRIDLVDCDAIDEPEPVTGPPLAAIGDFGWDGASCTTGTLVAAPADDPAARFCVVEGTRDGPFGRWDAEGSKASGGQYAGGLATGVWRTWYPGGTVHEEGTYAAGSRAGTWRTWRSDRSLEYEAAWVADQYDGTWTAYWPHGSKHIEGAYRAGAKVGTWQSWYATGIADEVSTWRATAAAARSERDGAYTRNHPNGLHAAEGAFVADLRSGAWQTWHDNGEPANAGSYEEGQAVGLWKTWERDGRIASEGKFVVGIAHGSFTFWGWQYGERIKSIGIVESGQLQGPWHASYDPGGPAGDVSYFDGLREGASTTIWKNGATASEGSYHQGELVGRWKFYYDNGQVFIDCGFVDGEYDGEYREFYDNGQAKAEGSYQGGAKQGDWRYWTEDGRPTTEAGS